MTKNKLNLKLNILILFSLITFFTGCPLFIEVKDLQNENFKIYLNTQAGIAFYELIESFNATNDTDQNQIFNSEQIKKALLQNNFSNVNVQISKPNSTTENLFLDFVTVKQKFNFINTTNGKTSITLTPKILQNLITNQNSIIQQYADLLMAPVFTDEQISKQEYIDLIKSVYGNKIADEILNSKITFQFVDSKNQKKSTTILLIDILTLQKELIIKL